MVRDRIPGLTSTSVSQGVTVEVGERQAAIDLDLVVEYGISIPDLAEGVRRNVIDAVERMAPGAPASRPEVTVFRTRHGMWRLAHWWRRRHRSSRVR